MCVYVCVCVCVCVLQDEEEQKVIDAMRKAIAAMKQAIGDGKVLFAVLVAFQCHCGYGRSDASAVEGEL